MPPPRMTANPKRPSRYRPGKGKDEHSDSEYETEEEEEDEKKKLSKQKPKSKSTPSTTNKVTGAFQEVSISASKPSAIVSKTLAIDEDEFETESEEDDDAASTPENNRRNIISRIERKQQQEEGEESSEERDEEEEEETETSSEDEAPVKLIRPTFIPKNQRSSTNTTNGKPQSEIRLAAEAEARRKEKADVIVQEQLERNAQLKAAERKAWDDSENEGVEGKTEAEVDDTDGIDPEAEYAAWKLRELKRIKRSREQIETAEKDREEIERRRNLTKEEREAEDAAHLAAQEEEREGKGKAGYMQRYFHKGAFFQDSAYAEETGLKSRDIMGSKFADQVTNREVLPEFMQIRDMAKLGRKGRTKYRDLKAEDTGRWGDFGRNPLDNRYKDTPGLADRSNEIQDERFKPDSNDRGNQQQRNGPSGANATVVHYRERRERRILPSSPPLAIAPSGPRHGNRGSSRSRSPPSRRRRIESRDRSRTPSRSRSRDKGRRRRYRSKSRSRSRSRDRDMDRRKRGASSPVGSRKESRFDKRVKVT